MKTTESEPNLMDNDEIVQNNDRMCMVPVVRDGETKPCGFMANGKTGLAIHRRFIHGIAGEFADRAKKQRRLNKANKGNMRQCPYCDFETYNPSAYTRHQKQKHPNETGFARIGAEKPTAPKVAPPSGALFDKVAELVAEKIFNKLMS